MEPLGYSELTTAEKMYLGDLMRHPGYAVLKKLMEAASTQATENVTKLDPEDAAYDAKLKSRHLVSRVTNDVCATLIKSVVMHSEAGIVENQLQKLKEEVGDVEVNGRLGSMAVKPRKGE